MADTTKIQWTDHTFNPWIGCTKVSPGCTNCYAEVNTFTRKSRAQGKELWGPKAERHITSEANWKQPHAWNQQAQAEGKRHRVFCASLADVFEDRADLLTARERLWNLIFTTPCLDWQLLTKRPQVMRQWMEAPEHQVQECSASSPARYSPFRNVWAMTSVENQGYADRRIPELLKVPARVRGLSVEPLLGPVDLSEYFAKWIIDPGLHWVICGGESGRHARPCHVEWVRDLVQQCQAAGVSCFVKQLGGNVRSAHHESIGIEDTKVPAGWHYCLKDKKGGDMAEWPEDLRVREFPA